MHTTLVGLKKNAAHHFIICATFNPTNNKQKMNNLLIKFIIILYCSVAILAINKYSKEANSNGYRPSDKPFRMQKLNILWNQANQVNFVK